MGIRVIVLGLAITFLLTTSAFAERLLCVSNKQLKGEQTVASCVAKGERFAVVDKFGIVHILTPEEVELTKALNPKIFETRAFGLEYQRLAPELPPLPAPTREAP